MDNVIWNRCQTPLEELHLDQYPNEVIECKDYTVYKHTSPSGRVYVGITKLSLDFRWNHGRGYKRCKLFWRAIQKYGWDNFVHEVVLEGVSKSEAIYAEKYLIRWYKMHNISYNITDGGESTTGFHMPEDAKKKISKYLKENRGKAVLQYTINGDFVQEFKSAAKAAEVLGCGHTSVSNCASGEKNLLYNYIFVYKGEESTLPRRLHLCEDYWKKYKIVQYKDNNVVNVFDSIRGAEAHTGINHLCISRNIRGLQKHAGGFTWRKIEESIIYGN